MIKADSLSRVIVVVIVNRSMIKVDSLTCLIVGVKQRVLFRTWNQNLCYTDLLYHLICSIDLGSILTKTRLADFLPWYSDSYACFVSHMESKLMIYRDL